MQNVIFFKNKCCLNLHYNHFRDHAAELGNAIPPKPLLFMKPPTCYIKNGQAIEVCSVYLIELYIVNIAIQITE